MPIIISKEAQRFAAEIDAPDALVHINCGLHSGFPKCCILFWVHAWLNEGRGQFGLSMWASYWPMMEALGSAHPGYIPCPACLLARNIVTVKPCTCSHKRTVKLEMGRGRRLVAA